MSMSFSSKLASNDIMALNFLLVSAYTEKVLSLSFERYSLIFFVAMSKSAFALFISLSLRLMYERFM